MLVTLLALVGLVLPCLLCMLVWDFTRMSYKNGGLRTARLTKRIVHGGAWELFRLEAERKNSDVMSTESLQGSELNDR